MTWLFINESMQILLDKKSLKKNMVVFKKLHTLKAKYEQLCEKITPCTCIKKHCFRPWQGYLLLKVCKYCCTGNGWKYTDFKNLHDFRQMKNCRKRVIIWSSFEETPFLVQSSSCKRFRVYFFFLTLFLGSSCPVLLPCWNLHRICFIFYNVLLVFVWIFQTVCCKIGSRKYGIFYVVIWYFLQTSPVKSDQKNIFFLVNFAKFLLDRLKVFQTRSGCQAYFAE